MNEESQDQKDQKDQTIPIYKFSMKHPSGTHTEEVVLRERFEHEYMESRKQRKEDVLIRSLFPTGRCVSQGD